MTPLELLAWVGAVCGAVITVTVTVAVVVATIRNLRTPSRQISNDHAMKTTTRRVL